MNEPVDFIHAQGVGNKLWRSRPLTREYPPLSVFYEFRIIKPGDPVPDAEGFLMGPFSE